MKLAKRSGSAIVKWDEELAKYAQEGVAREALPSGMFISVRAGQLSIAGQPVKDNKLQVVVVDYVNENAMYVGDFDADAPQPPVCYAFGRDEKDMRPHEKCSEPQSEACVGCPNNVFGSSERGKGKACKNIRRLALLSADNLSKESLTDGDVLYLKVPVTSVKAWALYVRGVASNFKRPAFAVVTELSVVPDPKSQFKLTFRYVGEIERDLLPALMQRREKVAEEIGFPYQEAAPVQPKKGKKKGKPEARPAQRVTRF